MINKHFNRCDWFETKFGEGSVLLFTKLRKQKKSFKHIAKALQEFAAKQGRIDKTTNRPPTISVSQLYKYNNTFVIPSFEPSQHVEKYYHRKNFEKYYIELIEGDARFKELARQANIIFGNFLPKEDKDDAGQV